MQRRENTEEHVKRVCCFCNTDEINDLKLGTIKWRNDVSVHYFCLLLATGVAQRGRDHEGIAGFLLPDIRREVKNCRFNVCLYCRRRGASIYCHQKNCRVVFHFPCGLRSGALSQFDPNFFSYCHEHRPHQEIEKYLNKSQLQRPWPCVICFEPVSPTDLLNSLWGPCCKKAAGYHRDCIQKVALNSGYLFRCPLCNEQVRFRSEMKAHGIYVPMQDASWELEENAYQEHEIRYNCDALECTCRYGRNYRRRGTRWDMVLCKDCGSQGVHLACGFLPNAKASWECNICRSVIRKTRETPVQPLHKYGSRFISKSKDVAMVQKMSAYWREEIYSRARIPSMSFTKAATSGNLNTSYRLTVHPDLHLPRAPLYRTPNRPRNYHLDKRICTNFDHYLVVDADRAPQKSPPVNYLAVIQKRHLIEDSDSEGRTVYRKDTKKDEFHIKYRRTYPVNVHLNRM